MNVIDMSDAVEHIVRREFRTGGSATIDADEETRRLEHGVGATGKVTGP